MVLSARFDRKASGEDEVCADGVWIDLRFDDPEGLLETPPEYYLGVEEDCRHCYIIKGSSLDQAVWEPLSDERYAFRMAADEENLFIELHAPREAVFTVQPEFRLFESVCPSACS